MSDSKRRVAAVRTLNLRPGRRRHGHAGRRRMRNARYVGDVAGQHANFFLEDVTRHIKALQFLL